MRKKIVAANWKMNLTIEEGKTLVENLLSQLPELNESKQVVIAPSYVHLAQTTQLLDEYEHIQVAAQNVSSEAAGAFTGEVSAAMLRSTGVPYAIIGHSERRQYFNETDSMLAKKIDMALANNLRVIFCCGEPLDVRDAERQNEYVASQIAAALYHLDAAQLQQITVAYEPIWAIGTGRTASSQQAQDMHAHIRYTLAGKYGAAVADNMTILYGGSCNDKNAPELFACPDVDGGLIGGASLKAETFLPIIQAMLAN